MQTQPHIKHKNEIKNILAVHKTWRTVNVRSRVYLCFVSTYVNMYRSSPVVKLLASESVNIRRTRVRVPASAILFFFFFNIHTSDKLEIFFDHSILVNAALMALTHGVYTVFLAALTMKTVYTPWIN